MSDVKCKCAHEVLTVKFAVRNQGAKHRFESIFNNMNVEAAQPHDPANNCVLIIDLENGMFRLAQQTATLVRKITEPSLFVVKDLPTTAVPLEQVLVNTVKFINQYVNSFCEKNKCVGTVICGHNLEWSHHADSKQRRDLYLALDNAIARNRGNWPGIPIIFDGPFVDSMERRVAILYDRSGKRVYYRSIVTITTYSQNYSWFVALQYSLLLVSNTTSDVVLLQPNDLTLSWIVMSSKKIESIKIIYSHGLGSKVLPDWFLKNCDMFGDICLKFRSDLEDKYEKMKSHFVKLFALINIVQQVNVFCSCCNGKHVFVYTTTVKEQMLYIVRHFENALCLFDIPEDETQPATLNALAFIDFCAGCLLHPYFCSADIYSVALELNDEQKARQSKHMGQTMLQKQLDKNIGTSEEMLHACFKALFREINSVSVILNKHFS